MEKKSLQLYFTDKDGAQKNFLGDVKLTSFTYNAKRMGGAPTIEGTINYPECLDDKWDASPYVIYNSEKFILLTKPSSSKSNDSICYRHDVTFVAQRIVLENVYFLDVVTPNTETAYKDRYRSNSTEFSTFCDIREFVARLNDSLIYSQLCKVVDGEYIGYRIVLDEALSTEPKEVTISSVTVAEAMQEIHNTFGLNYYWVGKTCYVGDVQNDIEEVFEYGAEGGLLVVGKENSNERIVTRISGHGGSENIPWYYPNDNEYGIVTYEADGAVVADIDSKKLVSAVGTYNGMTIRLCANDMAGTEYSYELSDADVHEDGEYFEEKYDEERGNYQNCMYVKTFRTIVKMPKGGRMNLSDAGAEYTYGGSTGLLLEQSPVTRTITVSQIEYFGQNRNDYSTVYGTEQIVCTDREMGVSTTHEVISEAFYLIETKLTFRYVSKAWRENAGVRSLTIADFEEELGGVVFSYTPANGEYYWLTANGQRVAYDKAGVTLASIPNLRYLESVYSWGVVTPAESYHRYVAMSVKNETSTGHNPVTINLTGRIWTTPSQHLMPSCYRESIGAERFMNAVNEKYSKGDGFYAFTNEYDAENPHEYIENHEDISPSIKYITNADGERIAEILDVAFDELDNDLYADDGSNESELIHSYFYIKLKRMDGENGFNIFQSASVKKAMSIHLTSGNCASCAFEIGTHSRVKTDGTGYDFYNPVQTDGKGNLLKVHDVSDSGFLGDYIHHELDPDSSTHGYDPTNQNTSTNEVWIAVRKDNSTFGVVMPNTNNNYRPNAGDSFVISGIDLPKTYILAAEKELDKALLDTMERSNVEKFNPSATFSRVFLATHESVAKRLNENARIRIKYNNVVYPLYVSDYTVKTDNSILYNISLTLVTDLSLQSSSLQNSISTVETNIINVLRTSEAVDSRYFVRRDKEGTINVTKDFKKDIIVRQKATLNEIVSPQYDFRLQEGFSLEAIRKGEYKFNLSHLEVWDTLNVKNLVIDGTPYTPPTANEGSGDCRFDDFFEVFYINNKPVIRAKYDFCSVGDISAFGYVKTELPSASVVIDQILTSGTPIAKINGTPIYAPAGGGTTNFAALTLKINGLNEQYIPTGDSKIFDLDAVYAKKGEGGNVNLDDYYTKTDINTLLKGYAKTSDIPTDYVTNDTLDKTVKNVNNYTNTQIAALNISQYAKASALEQVVADVNTAFDAVNNKFADYALLAGFNTFTGINRFDSRIYLSNALLDNVSTPVGAYFVVENNNNTYIYRHENYDYRSNYMTLRSDGKVFIDGGINEYIDIFGGTPHLDFHFNNTADFTSRITESASGVLELLSSSYNPGTLKIGNAYITYDSDNNALFVKGKDGASVNLVATGDVAAFSGLGSGFDTLTDLTLTNKLTVGNSIQLGTNSLAMDKYGALVIDGGKQQEIYFKGTAYFDSDLELDCVAANDAYLLESSIRTLYVGTSSNYKITEITTDGTNVYITINGKQYKLANA